jgi:hypothetical protein
MIVDSRYLLAMCFYYLFTISIETPILIAGLSRRHPLRHRVFAGFWLTACTYPFVWLVFPALINPNTHPILYLSVAETFAPLGECLLFWLAFGRAEPRSRAAFWQDMVVVTIANLSSFGVGLLAEDWLKRIAPA